MRLVEALRFPGQSSLAFVGAGGKTTALFRLGRELLAGRADHMPVRTVLATTTTHLGRWQASQADQLVWLRSESDLTRLESELPAGIVLLVSGQRSERLRGVSSSMLENVRLLANTAGLPFLIEADGARMKPLKAPGKHEPAIPGFVQTVVVVAGLSALGKPASGQWIHRPRLFTRLGNLHEGVLITADGLVKILCSQDGGLKNIPPGAKRVALLNQADTAKMRAQGELLAKQLLPVYNTVLVASLSQKDLPPNGKPDTLASYTGEVHARLEPVAGIVLAAGGSERFGQPKQLLPWQGQPLIRHVAREAIKAGLSPVEVVVGAAGAEITAAIKDLPLRIVNNQAWAQGMSTSIRAGLSALSEYVGGALFLQADQPQISSQLIHALVRAHQCSPSAIILPRVNGNRGNPVLFDRSVFPDLLTLEGDIGGRSLFEKYPQFWIEWGDPEILMDIDTPDDYQRLLEIHPWPEVNP
ncbi:MAG: selenium cofactor biosynthesis protein YqeC [Acidobacteriaceae bacterium]